MTIKNLAPVPSFQFFSNNGTPLAGGKVFTYAAGTTTKLTTWTDQAGATPNTNPIVLDASGRCDIRLTPGLSYKFVLSPSTDTDPPTNAIRTTDNIPGSAIAQAYFAPTTRSIAYTTTATDHQVPIEVTGTTTISLADAATMGAGYQVPIVNTGTGTVTVNLQTSGNTLNGTANGTYNLPSRAGATFVVNNAVNGYEVLYSSTIAAPTGSDGKILIADSTQSYGERWADPAARGMLAGCQLTWVSGTSLTMGAGTCRDDADTETMKLASALTMSNLTVGWVVGNNQPKIRTGVTLSNGMTLHAYVIKRTDTNVVDWFLTDEASNPTLPTSYTKSRRVLSLYFTAGAQTFPSFVQSGDNVYAVPVKNVNANALAAVALTTFSVPTGIKVRPRLSVAVGMQGTTANSGFYAALASPDAGSTAAVPVAAVANGPNNTHCAAMTNDFLTNTSAQLYYSSVQGAWDGGSGPANAPTAPTIIIYTIGWIDDRGRSA